MSQGSVFLRASVSRSPELIMSDKRKEMANTIEETKTNQNRGSMGSSTGGNNSPVDRPPKKKTKRNRQKLGRKFVVVWNNYPETAQKFIGDQLDQDCERCQFQTEVGDQGTPHIQGYIEFTKRCRPTEKYSNAMEQPSLCFITARGSAMQNAVYTSKDGEGGWDGKFRHTKNMPRPLAKVTYHMLREEQKEIVNLFKEPEDPIFGRSIHWFWEETGGWGKTTAVKYMVDQMGAIVTSGKAADVKYMIRDYCLAHDDEGPPIVIWHLPRTLIDAKYISYNAIESVKDGVFASPKFKGGMCRYNCPWVVIFANIPPDYAAMTEDRWEVEELK